MIWLNNKQVDTHTAGLPWKAMVSKEHRIQWSHLFTFFETKVGVKKKKGNEKHKKGRKSQSF